MIRGLSLLPKIFFFRKHIICTLLLFALFSSNAFGCDKKLSVSVGSNWPPFSYYQDNKFIGLDIEIVELILNKLNYCWEYISYPSSSRGLMEMKKGNIDIIFAASYTEERAEYAIYSFAYRYEVMQLFGSASPEAQKEISETSLVAINRGSYYGANFGKFIENCNDCVISTNLASERIKLVSKRRVDFAVEEYLAGNYIIGQENLTDKVTVTNTIINSNPVYYLLNPKTFSPQEINKLNKAIEDSDEAISQLVIDYHRKFDNTQSE